MPDTAAVHGPAATEALSLVRGFLTGTPGTEAALEDLAGCPLPPPAPAGTADWVQMQGQLARMNERGANRKRRGVYYTPPDVTAFLAANAARLACGVLRPDGLQAADTEDIPKEALLALEVFDPTCGAGEFLLAALELKLARLGPAAVHREVHRAVSTIHGNDADPDSILITKLRLFLCVLERFGPDCAAGLAGIMAPCFESRDYVTAPPAGRRYDLILGNPPYVEDGKSGLAPPRRYGNIYANVLEHAANQLRPGGALGFVVPLSYTATPRMGAIREVLFRQTPEQYILNFSDRPDCLFSGVHQKLCILLARNSGGPRTCFTGSYRYWYREERSALFRTAAVVRNHCLDGPCIPKLGSPIDVDIFQKIAAQPDTLAHLLDGDGPPVFLNMRATFWIKVFRKKHTGGEYRAFPCTGAHGADWALCLLSSSLFWWYWVCVSDCWHITKKELNGFGVPALAQADGAEAAALAARLERRLEATRRYVGTKQTEYEYKHRDCVAEIHAVDDLVRRLYGLTEAEDLHIRSFGYRYRISGGAGHECN